MNKVKRWLLHNTSLKIISVISAFAIWLMVSNTSNPERIESFSIPITLLNENVITGSNKVYSTDRSLVTVSYKIRTKDIINVKMGEFSASADFKQMSQEGKVPVKLSVSDNALEYIDEITISPSEIQVTTENILQKKFAVGKTIIGNVADGYYEGPLSVTPEYFYVKGPVSVVGQINSTGIVVDVSNASEDISGTAEIIFYDANGNVLSNIGKNLSYAGGISYSLPVYRTKSLSVNAFTGGSPASGYYVEGVETSPTFVTVYGTDEELAKYSYVLIPSTDLNINGVSRNMTFSVDASKYIPDGVSLVHPNTEIVIHVKVRDIPESEPQTEPETTKAHVYVAPTYPPETLPETVTVPVSEESSYETEDESTQFIEETESNDIETPEAETEQEGDTETVTEPETLTESDTEYEPVSEGETETVAESETESSHGDDI